MMEVGWTAPAPAFIPENLLGRVGQRQIEGCAFSQGGITRRRCWSCFEAALELQEMALEQVPGQKGDRYGNHGCQHGKQQQPEDAGAREPLQLGHWYPLNEEG